MTDLEAVHPGTGEVLEHLDQQPPEALAEALDAIHAREAELKRWGGAIEGELRRRMRALDRRLVVFGDWEVEQPIVRSSEWDAVELEAVLRRLIDEGDGPSFREVADVVTRAPVASRSAATALLRRLQGEAAEAVRETCMWREKPGKLTVARSVDLLAGVERAPGVETASPATASLPRDVPPPAGSGIASAHGAPGPPAPAESSSIPTPEELFS